MNVPITSDAKIPDVDTPEGIRWLRKTVLEFVTANPDVPEDKLLEHVDAAAGDDYEGTTPSHRAVDVLFALVVEGALSWAGADDLSTSMKYRIASGASGYEPAPAPANDTEPEPATLRKEPPLITALRLITEMCEREPGKIAMAVFREDLERVRDLLTGEDPAPEPMRANALMFPGGAQMIHVEGGQLSKSAVARLEAFIKSGGQGLLVLETDPGVRISVHALRTVNERLKEQPAPVSNDSQPVWELVLEDLEDRGRFIELLEHASEQVIDLVCADMRDRDQQGRQKYGVPLQSHNGRDALLDAYQELLDGAVYHRQDIAEALVAGDVARAEEIQPIYETILVLIHKTRAALFARDGK